MRWTQVCPLVGATLLACASEENQYPDPSSLMTEGGSSGSAGANAGGGNTPGGSASGGSAGSVSGSSNSTSGAGGSGGTFTNGGTFNTSGSGNGGTFSTGGTLAGGTGGGGTGGGTGAGGSAGAGGKPAGGAGGGGGTGGAGVSQCTGIVIPPKTSWQGTALRATDNDPPSKVFDGDITTRFTTGAAQKGDEWLQIDFGEVVTLNEVALHTNNNDYFRHFELRLSNTSQDFGSAVLAERDGQTGTMTVTLPKAHAGRYLTIRQTGMVATTPWWSLHEVTVFCK